MGQQQDRLFRMIDDTFGQAGLVIYDEGDDIAARDIFSGHDSELVPGNAFTKFDFFDRAAGNAAAHRGAKDHARQREIVNIARLPSQLGCALLAGNGDAHDTGLQSDLLLAVSFYSSLAPLLFAHGCVRKRAFLIDGSPSYE